MTSPAPRQPHRLAKPAQRAMAAAAYTTLEQVTQVTEADLAQLQRIGATAIEQLRQALAAAELSSPRELNQARLWAAQEARAIGCTWAPRLRR